MWIDLNIIASIIADQSVIAKKMKEAGLGPRYSTKKVQVVTSPQSTFRSMWNHSMST